MCGNTANRRKKSWNEEREMKITELQYIFFELVQILVVSVVEMEKMYISNQQYARRWSGTATT
jgi:hypothetical protein